MLHIHPIITCMHACMRTCIHAYMQAYRHTGDMHNHTYTHTYTHTYIHACMHTCMHRCMCRRCYCDCTVHAAFHHVSDCLHKTSFKLAEPHGNHHSSIAGTSLGGRNVKVFAEHHIFGTEDGPHRKDDDLCIYHFTPPPMGQMCSSPYCLNLKKLMVMNTNSPPTRRWKSS